MDIGRDEITLNGSIIRQPRQRPKDRTFKLEQFSMDTTRKSVSGCRTFVVAPIGEFGDRKQYLKLSRLLEER
jgi:hypothetical protein